MSQSVGSHSPLPAVHLSSEDDFNPHTYTNGRWLCRDKLERDARYLDFDFVALCKRVIDVCPGAVSIAKYEKTDGRFNRVFIFTCDNAKRAVARLPTSVAGPARLTTNSEVATVKYIQSNTTVPTPKILDWSDNPSNAIGSEYIITEHASGVQLRQRWPTMSGEQRISCIHSIFLKIRQIANIEFPAYGSLYFANAPLESFTTRSMTQDYCIGPHCGTRYSNCTVGEARYYNSTNPNRGPWSDLSAYCDGLIDTGFSRLPAEEITLSGKPLFHGSVASHTSLLNNGREVIRKLSEDPRVQDAATATLFHPNLHKRSIFVSDNDPTEVTDFIHWQSSSIEPAFEYADVAPDFTTPDKVASADKECVENLAALCTQAFHVCLQDLVPKLHAARVLNDSLLRPLRYCHRTWRDGAVAFRHELIEISNRWKELGLAGSCPYPIPTLDEMLVHQKEFKGFEILLQLKQRLIKVLNTTTDGWVPTESWEATKVAHKEAFATVLRLEESAESVGEEARNEEALRRIWPFDIDF